MYVLTLRVYARIYAHTINVLAKHKIHIHIYINISTTLPNCKAYALSRNREARSINIADSRFVARYIVFTHFDDPFRHQPTIPTPNSRPTRKPQAIHVHVTIYNLRIYLSNILCGGETKLPRAMFAKLYVYMRASTDI